MLKKNKITFLIIFLFLNINKSKAQLNIKFKYDSLFINVQRGINNYRIDNDTITLNQLNIDRKKLKEKVLKEKNLDELAEYYSLESQFESYINYNLQESLKNIKKTINIYEQKKDTLSLVKAYIRRSRNYFGLNEPALNFFELKKIYTKYKNSNILYRSIIYKKLSSIERFYYEENIDFSEMTNEFLVILNQLKNNNYQKEYIDLSIDLLTFCNEDVFNEIYTNLISIDLNKRDSYIITMNYAKNKFKNGYKKTAINILIKLIKKLKDTPKEQIKDVFTFEYDYINTYYFLIKYYIDIKDFDKAQYYYDKFKSEKNQDKNNVLDEKFPITMKQLHAHFKRYDKAFYLINNMFDIQRRLYKKSIKKLRDDYKSKLTFEKNKLKNKALKNELKTNEKIIKQQYNYLTTLLILLILLMVFLYKIKKMANLINKDNITINKLNLNLKTIIKEVEDTNKNLLAKNKEIDSLLAFNEKTLFSKVLKISTYNDNIKTIIHDIKNNINSPSNIKTSDLLKIERKLKNLITEGNIWEEFKIQFEKIRPSFFKKLKEINPDLSINDLKHCSYVVLKLKTKEVAALINSSPRSVETARYRLKKKLNIETNDKLFDFLQKL